MHAARLLCLRERGTSCAGTSSARGWSRAAILANSARRSGNLRLRKYVFLRAARHPSCSRRVAQRTELRFARCVHLFAQQHGEAERRGFLQLAPCR